MSKAIFVQVTVYDDESGAVERHMANHYDGSYGYEVERMFTQLGQKLAPLCDPYHEANQS